MIAWSYVNTTTATIAAVRDYLNMRFIIENTPDDIARAEADLIDPGRTPVASLPPSQTGYHEDKLPDRIYRLDVLRERYGTAREFMAWFEPAWSFLSDEERTVLSEFYLQDTLKSGGTQRVMEALNVSESTAERFRGRAVAHLRTLLYGRR
jgi:hypothetical protein